MNAFLQKHRDVVMGYLSGFDRLVLRGTLRQLCYIQGGMSLLLSSAGVLLKDFGMYAHAMSQKLKEASLAVVLAAGRPVHYLYSSAPQKELIAKQIAKQDKIEAGPICTLTCVECCYSYDIYKNRDTFKLELRHRLRKGLHLYHYFIHPVFGFMHARIQTWFPFSIQLCINGREWLARQMDQAGLGYVRKDNAFVDLENPVKTQELMNTQLAADWKTLLGEIAHRINPAHDEMFEPLSLSYYWSIHQSEWATDILFKSPCALAKIYPALIQHGIRTFGSPDVMRFLGKQLPAHGNVHRKFAGDVVTDLKDRPEGVRIKHRTNRNSIKLYDKQGSVLRVECTLNDTAPFRVFRKPEGRTSTPCNWLPLRKGIADISRRCDVSQKATERYLDALAAVESSTPLGHLAKPLCQSVSFKGRRSRGLNPFRHDDLDLLTAISAAEFCIYGLRNRDLRTKLFHSKTNDPIELRRRSSAITRKLRLLRAHGLIKKVPRTHRYLVTQKGRTAITALLAARDANTKKLTEFVA